MVSILQKLVTTFFCTLNPPLPYLGAYYFGAKAHQFVLDTAQYNKRTNECRKKKENKLVQT